jgi:cation/acetate symporter
MSHALAMFLGFIAVTLWITWWAARKNTGSSAFFAAGRSLTAWQNGIAVAGDYMSAASFLGIAGIIAFQGYDGFMYSVGWLVAYLTVLLIVAEPLRNAGKYTMADVLAYRLSPRPVRGMGALSTLTVSTFYMIAQMVGAGALVSLLLQGTGITYQTAVIGIGVLMIVYVVFGGMLATTWVQIVKAVLLMAGAIAMTVLVLTRFHGDFNQLLNSAAERSGHGKDFLSPGLKYGGNWTARLDFISLGLALVLGTAGLPHILSRFYTVPTARAARRSVVWSIGLIGSFYLMTIVLGFGAAAVVGSDAVRASNAAGNTAVPLLSLNLGGGAGSTGGTVLFAVVAAVAFATILAVVAGITLASSASVAHDLYASLKRRHSKQRSEVAVARVAAVGIGAAAIALGLLARDLNVAFLVGLAFAVAASANLPVLLYSLFWRNFTTRGAVWSVYGGLIPAVLLVVFSPVVTGSPEALFPGVDFHVFPLQNPGLVSIPLGFLAGWIGTVTSTEPPDAAKHAETEVRALTGAGAV